MQVLELSKQNIDLSRAEAEAVCGKGKLVDNYLIVDCNLGGLEHLFGYTKSVGKFGFFMQRGVSLKDVAPLIKGKYKLTFRAFNPHHKKEIIGFTKEIPKVVNFEKPDTILQFIQVGEPYGNLCVINPVKNPNDFESRKAHKRPENHPSSLHPKLARAYVNLTGITKGTLFDPLCGSGGILIEAGLRGVDPVGSDINQIQVNRAKINCNHYGVVANITKQDVFTVKKKYNYIATDVAYGKNTVMENNFITKFLEFLPKILGKRAVVGLPSFFDEKKVLKKIKSLKVIGSFEYYLHKSLSKKILVIEKV